MLYKFKYEGKNVVGTWRKLHTEELVRFTKYY